MSDKFIIKGNIPLRGKIKVGGSKNATTPLIAATLLTSEACVLDNIPLIRDVLGMIELIKSVGAEVEWLGERKIKIQAKNLDPNKIDKNLVSKMRSSILIAGPLLARSGFLKINSPGGCIIGSRAIDTHLSAFEEMGVVQRKNGGDYNLIREEKNNKNREIILDEFSVTATENILMMAALGSSKTKIEIAAAEPHVRELILFLRKMGVDIKGEGTHTIEIIPKKKLKGANHVVIPDYIEAGTYVLMAAAIGKKVLIENVPTEDLMLFLKKIRKFGVNYKIIGRGKIEVTSSPKIRIPKIQSWIHPGVATDLLSAFGVLATQSHGLTLIHEPLYEGRLKYLEELNKMGAEIIICDPHRAIINGPTKLYGGEVGPLDLRGGAALIIAGLIAKGTTTVNNITQIDRGYEKIEEKIQKLGGNIKRIVAIKTT